MVARPFHTQRLLGERMAQSTVGGGGDGGGGDGGGGDGGGVLFHCFVSYWFISMQIEP